MSIDHQHVEQLEGVVFHRTVRSTYSVLLLAIVVDVVSVPTRPRSIDNDMVHTRKDDKMEEKDTIEKASRKRDFIVVRIQMGDLDHSILRSWCRRTCKIGDLLLLTGHRASLQQMSGIAATAPTTTEWTEERFVVDITNEEDAAQRIVLKQTRYWDMGICQEWQKRCMPPPKNNQGRSKQTTKRQRLDNIVNDNVAGNADDDANDDGNAESSTLVEDGTTSSAATFRHGGGLGKRQQGEHLANFLVHVMMYKLGEPNLPPPEDWSTTTTILTTTTTDSATPSSSTNSTSIVRAIQQLNFNSGVIDAAGGSGHVSMALGLRGIQSTVVDPRKNVGKLPSKDRKVWNRAMRDSSATKNGVEAVSPVAHTTITTANTSTVMATTTTTATPKAGNDDADLGLYCQPIHQNVHVTTVQPYQSLRAWFATKPEGVDPTHRHPDEDHVEICAEDHVLLQNCSAIVALHPDEATDAIVDMAVRKRIPFCIMPCCVFSRIFVHRRLGDGVTPVRTYLELIDYLMAKDDAIQKTVLPFEGANIALWATFS